MAKRSFSAINDSIKMNAKFNNVSTDFSQEDMLKRTAQIFEGLGHAKLGLNQTGPDLKI